VDLTFVLLPHGTLLWSRIDAKTDLASHHNPNDIQQNIELTESLLNEMCGIKQQTVEDDKNQNQPLNLKEHRYGKGIRALSSKCDIQNLAKDKLFQ
jgi:hypothetical protein